MSPTTKSLISMSNINVYYNDFHALKGMDFNLFPGEIHGLVGEHRAGKSTLVKLLCGEVHRQSGIILFKGSPLDRITPLSAKQMGISLNHQFLNIIPSLNAVENIFSGQPIRGPFGFIKKKAMERESSELFRKLGVEINIHVPVNHLSNKDQHIVELAISLSNNPEIIIFDEISSKLTPEEMETVFGIIRDFRKSGKSVIYITHNIDEIFRLADRVTIIKGGQRCGTEEIQNLDRIKLIKLTYNFVRSRQELEEDNRELHLLKRFNESIMDNIPVGLLLLDKDNSQILSNKAARIVMDTDELNHLSPEGWIRAQGWKEEKEILKRLSERKQGNWDRLSNNGNKIYTLKSIPFSDNDFKFFGTILIIEDITQQTGLNDYLIRSEKIASIAEMAAGVAHEVNNPLGIVLNYVSLLKRSTIRSDDLESLQKIESEILRIGDITKSLLSFSRTSANLEPVELKELLEDSLLLISHPVKHKNISLISELPEYPVTILGSANQIKQVILNLCINAIEAVLEEGEISLKLHVDQTGTFCEIIVEDNGSGISIENNSRIFDPFFTTKSGKNNTGLGLSVTQHIVESHGGIISYDSREKTTRFTVRFPMSV